MQCAGTACCDWLMTWLLRWESPAHCRICCDRHRFNSQHRHSGVATAPRGRVYSLVSADTSRSSIGGSWYLSPEQWTFARDTRRRRVVPATRVSSHFLVAAYIPRRGISENLPACGFVSLESCTRTSIFHTAVRHLDGYSPILLQHLRRKTFQSQPGAELHRAHRTL